MPEAENSSFQSTAASGPSMRNATKVAVKPSMLSSKNVSKDKTAQKAKPATREEVVSKKISEEILAKSSEASKEKLATITPEVKGNKTSQKTSFKSRGDLKVLEKTDDISKKCNVANPLPAKNSAVSQKDVISSQSNMAANESSSSAASNKIPPVPKPTDSFNNGLTPRRAEESKTKEVESKNMELKSRLQDFSSVSFSKSVSSDSPKRKSTPLSGDVKARAGQDQDQERRRGERRRSRSPERGRKRPRGRRSRSRNREHRSRSRDRHSRRRRSRSKERVRSRSPRNRREGRVQRERARDHPDGELKLQNFPFVQSKPSVARVANENLVSKATDVSNKKTNDSDVEEGEIDSSDEDSNNEKVPLLSEALFAPLKRSPRKKSGVDFSQNNKESLKKESRKEEDKAGIPSAKRAELSNKDYVSKSESKSISQTTSNHTESDNSIIAVPRKLPSELSVAKDIKKGAKSITESNNSFVKCLTSAPEKQTLHKASGEAFKKAPG